MALTIGQQGNFTLTISGMDADNNNEPFEFEIDRLDYPTVTKVMTHCPLVTSRLNPKLLDEIIEKLPEGDRKKIIEKLDELQETEHRLLISYLEPYFPDRWKKLLKYQNFDELVNWFYYLATGNEEIKSLHDITKELEDMQENYRKEKGLVKKKAKKKVVGIFMKLTRGLCKLSSCISIRGTHGKK